MKQLEYRISNFQCINSTDGEYCDLFYNFSISDIDKCNGYDMYCPYYVPKAISIKEVEVKDE